MQFWKFTPLIDDIRANKVSQKDQLCYFIAASFFYGSAHQMYFSNYLDSDNIYADLLFLMEFVLMFLGPLYCYKINKSLDDKDFLIRFITLSFPSTIRFFAVLIIYIFGYEMSVGIISGGHLIGIAREITAYDFVVNAIFSIGLFYYIGTKIKCVATLPKV